jgi:hypothetical protein
MSSDLGWRKQQSSREIGRGDFFKATAAAEQHAAAASASLEARSPAGGATQPRAREAEVERAGLSLPRKRRGKEQRRGDYEFLSHLDGKLFYEQLRFSRGNYGEPVLSPNES